MKNNTVSVFLTVGNKKQKKLCEKLLLAVRERLNIDISVISDDDFGCRLGSGGAVLNILDKAYKPGKKILVINSGGVSKRSVNYSVRGKAFANVENNNEQLTLLELIVSNAVRMLGTASSGVLICCSDILVDAGGIDFSSAVSSGVCIRADFSTASRHGVMLCDSNGTVTDYLHKRPEQELREAHSGVAESGAMVDSGITFISDDVAKALYDLVKDEAFAKKLFSGDFELCLYSDILALLAKNTSREEYLATETSNEEHRRIKEMLYTALNMYSMKAVEAKDQSFLHFGSLAESLENIFCLSDKKTEPICFNSFVNNTEIGEKTLLDNAILNNCKIGKGCIVSDITLENEEIADSKTVCGIKLDDGSFVSVVCDVSENSKNKIGKTSLWDLKRFYKGFSFNDSYSKFKNNVSEEKYSLDYCLGNADYDYYFTRQQYLKDMQGYNLSKEYEAERNRVLEAYFSSHEPIRVFECTKSAVAHKLPLRVNLSGTWTDAMPYCIHNGGQVINLAVKIDGKLPICISVEKLESGRIELCNDNVNIRFCFEKKNEEDLSEFNLHKAVLETVGINSKTVLKDGFRLSVSVSDIDKGSGLGISSILLGGCFKALGEMLGREYSFQELARMAFVAEQIMKTGGGWQDQAGGLTAGLKVITSSPGIEQTLTVEKINLSHFFEKIFSERLVLMPTGQRHFGRFIVNDVVNRYLSKNSESLEGHKKIRELNARLINSLNSDDYAGFVDCINAHRKTLEMISHKVTNKNIDEIVDKCLEKADAVSILGAGGGGYLLVVLKDGVSFEEFCGFARKSFLPFIPEVRKIEIYNEI